MVKEFLDHYPGFQKQANRTPLKPFPENHYVLYANKEAPYYDFFKPNVPIDIASFFSMLNSIYIREQTSESVIIPTYIVPEPMFLAFFRGVGSIYNVSFRNSETEESINPIYSRSYTNDTTHLIGSFYMFKKEDSVKLKFDVSWGI